MRDDVVIRLRVATVADDASTIYDTMTDAANEIERLRSELAQWRKVYKELVKVYGQLLSGEPEPEISESLIRREMYPRNRYSGD